MDEKEKDLNIETEAVTAEVEQENNDAFVYEIGYQLLPTLNEDEVAGEIDSLRQILEKYQSEIIAEGSPALKDLSYEMKKKVSGKYQKFHKGYFGWIKFATEAANTDKIKREIDASESVLRFILISTVRENTIFSQRPHVIRKPEAEKGVTEDGVEGEVMTEEVMDQEIDKTLEDLELK
jgi:ribosomal protein S6